MGGGRELRADAVLAQRDASVTPVLPQKLLAQLARRSAASVALLRAMSCKHMLKRLRGEMRCCVAPVTVLGGRIF